MWCDQLKNHIYESKNAEILSTSQSFQTDNDRSWNRNGSYMISAALLQHINKYDL